MSTHSVRALDSLEIILILRVGYWRFPGRLIRKFSVFVLDMDDLGIFAALCAQKNLSIVLDTLARFFLLQRQGIQLNEAIASKLLGRRDAQRRFPHRSGSRSSRSLANLPTSVASLNPFSSCFADSTSMPKRWQILCCIWSIAVSSCSASMPTWRSR